MANKVHSFTHDFRTGYVGRTPTCDRQTHASTRSRDITMPAPHHSRFYRLDALPAAQPTASKHEAIFPQYKSKQPEQ